MAMESICSLDSLNSSYCQLDMTECWFGTSISCYAWVISWRSLRPSEFPTSYKKLKNRCPQLGRDANSEVVTVNLDTWMVSPGTVNGVRCVGCLGVGRKRQIINEDSNSTFFFKQPQFFCIKYSECHLLFICMWERANLVVCEHAYFFYNVFGLYNSIKKRIISFCCPSWVLRDYSTTVKYPWIFPCLFISE